MRNKVLLESLTVGRCFTLPIDPPAPQPGGASPDTLRTAVPVLEPAQAWKVTGDAEGGVAAVSAAGAEQTFAADTEVVEIPRQGYDTLASRA